MPTHLPPYPDRAAAGRDLATHLARWAGDPRVLVLALPRGGVPVAVPVADMLRAPLDVLVVRKLGLPTAPEVAMGALAGVGDVVVEVDEPRVRTRARVTAADVARVRDAELAELRRREVAYREGRPPIDVRGRVAVLVDDGLATGASVRAAVAALRPHVPARVVVAVPVGAGDACAALRAQADDLVCVRTPADFRAVGQEYVDFAPPTDADVRALLRGRSSGPTR